MIDIMDQKLSAVIIMSCHFLFRNFVSHQSNFVNNNNNSIEYSILFIRIREREREREDQIIREKK